MAPITTSTASLLVGYLGVCNEALARNRESFPYKQLLAIYEKLFAGRDLGVRVYADDPADEIAHVTVRYINGRYEPVASGNGNKTFRVKLKKSYMEKVVANRGDYVRHPEKLDWDWLRSRVGMDTGEASTKVLDIMTRGLRPVAHDATIQEASRMMCDLGIGALPIIDGQTLIGMVTDRDITVRATAKGVDPRVTPVRQVMTSTIASCSEDTDLEHATQIMRTLRIRRLLVLDGAEHPVGMLSLGNIALRADDKRLAGALLAAISNPLTSRA